jgi:hypothetical protein
MDLRYKYLLMSREELCQKIKIMDINRLRSLNNLVLALPYCCALLQWLDSLLFHFFTETVPFWIAFCASMLPLSVLALLLQLMIRRRRLKLQLPLNDSDSIRMFLSIIGIAVGLILWAFIALIMNS